MKKKKQENPFAHSQRKFTSININSELLVLVLSCRPGQQQQLMGRTVFRRNLDPRWQQQQRHWQSQELRLKKKHERGRSGGALALF